MTLRAGLDSATEAVETRATQRAGILKTVLLGLSIALVAFLALYNLTNYPLTWFDEGSHLHVPKTLVRFGVYADYSSEGFRHYGPTIGVGPTVMLPIAGVFQLFGIGLLQARLVMALYLLAAIYAFYRLAQVLGGNRFAWVATVLVATSRGVALLLWGRQVLGEVPGFFFIAAGLALWFARWERSKWWQLIVVGVLLGLAMVTKYQYLLFLAPTLLISWVANLVYYRSAPQRVFLVPGIVAAACFALWQVYTIVYLGPATAAENWAILRRQSAGAAMVLSPDLMQKSLSVLVSIPVYLGSLLPALIYGVSLALPRRREGQQWGVLLVLVAVNLGWYVLASIGWWRYAFLGLVISSLFVARFFHDLTGGFALGWKELWDQVCNGGRLAHSAWLRSAMLVWLVLMVVLDLGQSVVEIVHPAYNAPRAMAAYLDENVPEDVLVETWEPEMGFLTDHNYHFPPAQLLTDAVSQAHLGGQPVSQLYDFVQTERPAYVLVGEFGRGVALYPRDVLSAHYELETHIGGYELYSLK